MKESFNVPGFLLLSVEMIATVNLPRRVSTLTVNVYSIIPIIHPKYNMQYELHHSDTVHALW